MDDMHHGGYVRWDAVATGMLWSAVAAFIGAAWIICLSSPDRWRLAGMLAATACATSAFAATLHVRTYIVRLCRVVRVATDLEPGGVSEPGELRPLR